MSYIEKLLDGVEVEWKTIDNLFHIKNGYTPSRSNQEYWKDGTIPWFRMEDIRQNGRVLNKSIQHVNTAVLKGRRIFPANSIIIATSATIGEHALVTVPFLSNQRFTCLSLKTEYVKEFEIKFLFYYAFILDEWCKNNITVGNFAGVDMNGFKKFLIPIPPLSVQKEIVRILDKFTALAAELAAELAARKKQYNYYRGTLLSFEEGEVEWKTLGEVAVIGTGSHDTQDAVDDGNYTFYARGLTPLKLNSYDFDETAIITAGDGVGVGKVFHWAMGKYALHQRAYRIVPNANADVDPRYIYHYVVANFYTHIKTTSVHSSVTSLRKPMFLKFAIPIPSLEEQQRIVAILDTFDTLTTSISEGLPKEIELRKKQYEYYRDLLLTFPKNNIES